MLPQRAQDPAEAAFLQGNARAAAGDAAGAAAAFRHCLALAPTNPGALFNLGNALMAQGDVAGAAAQFLRCARGQPGFAGAYVNLSTALLGLGKAADANAIAEIALHLAPDDEDAVMALGNARHAAFRFAEAAALYRRLPGHAPALGNLGNSLRGLGRLEEALAALEAACALAPRNAEQRFNRATALLAAGRWAEGWPEYESRWQRPGQMPDRGFGPPWRAEDIAGRTILLHAEQGLGDTLQFLRYVPLVAARGARVVLEVQGALLRLARSVAGAAQVLARGEPLPAFDAHCPLLSLPLVFNTRVETAPAATPYISADPALVAAWRARLPAGEGRVVGLAWGGSPLPDPGRSLPEGTLAVLSGLDGLRFISLQMPGTAPPPGLPLWDGMAAVTDMADTAALIGLCDLVVSVDTSVAHLAGALGRPTLLLCPQPCCWRWLTERADSPWYPTMRLFRQASPGEWGPVLAEVRQALSAWLNPCSP